MFQAVVSAFASDTYIEIIAVKLQAGFQGWKAGQGLWMSTRDYL